jgi:hypothetical protein
MDFNFGCVVWCQRHQIPRPYLGSLRCMMGVFYRKNIHKIYDSAYINRAFCEHPHRSALFIPRITSMFETDASRSRLPEYPSVLFPSLSSFFSGSISFHPSFLLPFFLQTSTGYGRSADHLRQQQSISRPTGRTERNLYLHYTLHSETLLQTESQEFFHKQGCAFIAICCSFFEFCRRVHISFLVHPSLQQVGRQREKTLQCSKPRS